MISFTIFVVDDEQTVREGISGVSVPLCRGSHRFHVKQSTGYGAP